MKIRLLAATIVIVCLVFGAYTLRQFGGGISDDVFSDAVLTVGFTGKDVVELQGRLRYLGYYDGEITGTFDQKTKNAVTWFQWKFGLKADGIVGPKTKLKLWEATKNWRPTEADKPKTGGGGGGGAATGGGGSANLAKTHNLSENDIRLMANAVYGEARGEPYEGQVAVAAVILNRVKSPNFPDTVSGVIFQPGAFTAVADGQIWLTPNETARKAVIDAANGWDPTGGCLYYFNPETATSKWIWTRPQVKRIGKHIFCM
ncbi:Spore cortex-lytic enzyme sleB [Thermobacillus xylanilyticus]|jgi:N-acetylmuramoyl-L-alanine amidase|uniref:Spore cortex-lytic enzyme n=1 Tax=Thermobacillus xylanilyticus TaxID=76633 RepID=A0ABM8UZV3_THEXY|nr:spore cortex-lytic enzyme [Thermobacillus xylanilyticus]REJ16102.1 MAG: spore cortex-lytic enzyme [Paenibacillaceae bacterium]CAG5077623.1 Spore cortex-lytic enzyme sleB [Thermobacillus xylanilyticus]